MILMHSSQHSFIHLHNQELESLSRAREKGQGHGSHCLGVTNGNSLTPFASAYGSGSEWLTACPDEEEVK